jgi:hypothetical protein
MHYHGIKKELSIFLGVVIYIGMTIQLETIFCLTINIFY